MHLKLRDQQLNHIYIYIYIAIYKPHINHRPKIYNTYTHEKKKESCIILYLLFFVLSEVFPYILTNFLKGSMILWEWRYQSLLKTFIIRHLFLVWLLKIMLQGFPGGAVVENLPASAGDTGSSPGLGGSHVPWSNWAREPQLLSLRVWSLCSATREAAIVRGPHTAMKSGPRLPQLEKALTQKQRPNTAINK